MFIYMKHLREYGFLDSKVSYRDSFPTFTSTCCWLNVAAEQILIRFPTKNSARNIKNENETRKK